MSVVNLQAIKIFHITHLENLSSIIKEGVLLSDEKMQPGECNSIGYNEIKSRRLTSIRIPCLDNRFVGSCVPFYFCPRSPMLYVVNKGRTGLPIGCQKDIIHLVSNVSVATKSSGQYAFSDSNAGSYYAGFGNDLAKLDTMLDWDAIRNTEWSDSAVKASKQAEFLVADSFPWHAIQSIGCYDPDSLRAIQAILTNVSHVPMVAIEGDWYY